MDLRYTCPSCGSTKTLLKPRWIVECDHCGGLVCADYDTFEGDKRYQGLVSSISSGLASSQDTITQLEQAMETAKKAGERQKWREFAAQKEVLTLAAYPDDFFLEHYPDQEPDGIRRRMAASNVAFWDKVYFVPDVSASLAAFDQANQALGSLCFPDDDTGFKAAHETLEACARYYERVYAHHDPSRFGLRFDLRQQISAAVSSLLHGILHHYNIVLSPNAKARLATTWAHIDPSIKEKAESLAEDALVRHRCPRCGLDEAIGPREPAILLCEACLYVQDDKADKEGEEAEPLVSCTGCGGPVEAGRSEGVFTCPWCEASVRRRFRSAEVARQYLWYYANYKCAYGWCRGIWEDDDTLKLADDLVRPMLEEAGTDDASLLQAIAHLPRPLRVRLLRSTSGLAAQGHASLAVFGELARRPGVSSLLAESFSNQELREAFADHTWYRFIADRDPIGTEPGTKRKEEEATKALWKGLVFATLSGDLASLDAQLVQDPNLARAHQPESPSYTLLHLAAQEGQIEVIRWLVSKGADPNAADAGGGRPLHLAARNHRSEALKVLVELGADLNAGDVVGQTPLRTLENFTDDAPLRADEPPQEQEPSPEINEKGFFSWLFGATRKKAAQAAKAAERAAVQAAFVALNAEAKLQLRKAHKVMALMVELGADLNLADNEGKTPLMVAAEDNKPNTLRHLLALGANPNLRNGYGRTALDEAKKGEHMSIIEILQPLETEPGPEAPRARLPPSTQTPKHEPLRRRSKR